MEYINLGKTGMRVSRVCLGMMTYGTPQWREWVLDEASSRPIIQRALELGINFFDTADMYSLGVSEEITGRAIRDLARRDEVIVATKVYWPVNDDINAYGLSRKHIMDSIDNSLRRLDMDYVDLYIIHRWDYNTPVEETLEALNDIVRAGKARYIGASSMFAWQFAKALYTCDLHGWTRFVSMQNHYNLIYREEEREMNPLCLDQGIGITPWSPLARGFLAGNRTRSKSGDTARSITDNLAHDYYYRDDDFAVMDRVIEVANRLGYSPAQVALAWILHKPGITCPVIGASKVKHLEESVAVVDITLTAEDMAYLEEPYQPHPILGHS
ncbi:MAG: aldo/keto reductase [Anaerolineae bacterium]|nr:aldo/keto reductase [Anaerolineae bacterium]